MHAEQLIDLLQRHSVLAPDVIAELRGRVAHLTEPVPADACARRLVESGLLRAELVPELLRQLETEAAAPSPSVPSGPPAPPAPPAAPPLPAPPHQRVSRPQRFDLKKTAANPWESKLILIGLSAILVLILLGVFFSGSIFKRSADRMFASANEAYNQGSYSQAITAYTHYIDGFPGHSGVPTAKIRRALARIRQRVDAKTDWPETYETAVTEIESVRNEIGFFEESKAELANLLPKIAAGLADLAEEQTSMPMTERAEKTLAMIDALLPRSLRPESELSKTRHRVERVSRILVRDDRLNDVNKDLQSLLARNPFARADVEEAYKTLDALLVDYPELETDERLQTLLRQISKTESRAITPIPSENLPPCLDGVDAEAETTDRKAVCRPAAVLFYGKSFETPTQGDPGSNSPPVLLASGGSFFGLRSDTGRPLWKRNIGPRHGDFSAFSDIIPIPGENPSALIVDTRKHDLLHLDGLTGKTLRRWAVGEPFRISEITPTGSHVALAVRSGSLLIVSLADATVRGYRLPQDLQNAPLIDFETKTVLQFANRETLYRLPLAPGGSVQAIFTGQKPESLRLPPRLLNSNLLLIRQSPRTPGSLLDLVALDDQTFEAKTLQTVALTGFVDTPVSVDGEHLAAVSDTGEITLFEQTGDPAKPLREVAKGSAGAAATGDADRHGVLRFSLMEGRQLWIADRQLTRFEPQFAQSRILPRKTLRQDIVTSSPIFRHENVLFHAFRRPGFGGISLEAVNMDAARILWETELADPVVMEPLVSPNGEISVYTSTGRLYRFKIDLRGDDSRPSVFQGEPISSVPAGVFGQAPLSDVIPLRDGYSAWFSISRNENPSAPATSSRAIMIYDPNATDDTRFIPRMLPVSMAGRPLGLAGSLLVPLVDGQVVLLDAATGKAASEPFVPVLTPDAPASWSDPISRDETSFLIVRNRGLESALHLVALEQKADRADSPLLTSKLTHKIDGPALPRLARIENRVVWVDTANNLNAVRIEADRFVPEKTTKLPAAPTWGPYAVGDVFLLATSDGRLHVFSGTKNVEALKLPRPVGLPCLHHGRILIAAETGSLYELNPDSRTLAKLIDTEIPIASGPAVLNDHIILAARDGTVYLVTMNTSQ